MVVRKTIEIKHILLDQPRITAYLPTKTTIVPIEIKLYKKKKKAGNIKSVTKITKLYIPSKL